jgi:hypothetical protein
MSFRGEFGSWVCSLDVGAFQPHLITWSIRCECLWGFCHKVLCFLDAILRQSP